ncbi:rhodanese-like domain-containing protein [Desulfitobacterium sp. PCE1]|uniref:rhodanese-like domain-containing protein n=1 Tax=Desulfitobacterium sp. PCE1 TaxID=146907 RepID=UPI00036BAFBA|nr:rhodanese-like domain-containing protein [Desulfitobacterium sp. PCE1]
MNQNTVWIILAVIILGWILVQTIRKNKFKISPQEGKELLDSTKGVILLDVRTPEEYQEIRIPKSKLIPLAVLKTEAPQKIKNKDAQILVYCRSGNRSAAAARILFKLGYTNVKNMGGIIHWPFETVSGKK